MSIDDASRLLIAVAIIQWPITIVAAYWALRERTPALSFTVGMFIVLSLTSTLGGVLGFIAVNDIKMPVGFYSAAFVAMFLTIALIQPLWALYAVLGRFR